MQKRSLADAKAHLSELVDAAEHKKARILILRHGKPAAAIVPVEVATKPKKKKRKKRTAEEIRKSYDEFKAYFSALEPEVSAVDDLIMGRR